MGVEAELQKLTVQGWSLDPEAVQHILQHREDPNEPLLKTLLNTDLTQIGIRVLPDDINRAVSIKLTGPHVLQVLTVTDTAQPARLQDTKDSGSSKGRLLRLSLTDGKQKCIGIEYSPLEGVKKEHLIPGTKVKVYGATVKLGVVLLTSKCLQVLGGRVEEMADAYEVQQKYGGTVERATEGGGEATGDGSGAVVSNVPPKFQHFDPKAVRAGGSQNKKAGTAPTAATGDKGSFNQQQQEHQVQQQKQGGKKGGKGVQPPPPPPPGILKTFERGQQQQQQQQQMERAEEGKRQKGGRGPREKAPKGGKNIPLPPPPATAAAAAANVSQLVQGSQSQQQQLQQEAVGGGTSSGEPYRENPSAGGAGGAPGGDLAKAKLLEKLQAKEQQDTGRYGGRGRSRGRGRRGRFHDDDDDGSSMTLEEYEAKQKAKITLNIGGTSTSGGGGGGMGGGTDVAMSDEELARKLQAELDLEDARSAAAGRKVGPESAVHTGTAGTAGGSSDLQSSLLGMFSFDRNSGNGDRGGRGGRRGRGRGRGRR